MRKIVVGVTGASGSQYAFAALRALRTVPDLEIHLVVSDGARETIRHETDESVDELEALAHVRYDDCDLASAISSGSFLTDGMLVIPCSMRSAASIAYSMNGNLLTRAADVTLKERRRLVLVVRETPLHLGHLRTLVALAEIGAVIMPPMPGLYARPQSVQDIVNHSVGKALDQLGIHLDLFKRWKQPAAEREAADTNHPA